MNPSAVVNPRPTADPQAVLADELLRHLRSVHALKTVVARDTSEAERAKHSVLFVLHDAGPLRVSHLAERLGTDPSTTSRQTTELLRSGLLRREPDPQDRRAGLLAVTGSGRDAVHEMRGRRRELVARAVADWSTEDVVLLTDLVARLTDGIDRTRTDLLTRPGAARETPAAATSSQEDDA